MAAGAFEICIIAGLLLPRPSAFRTVAHAALIGAKQDRRRILSRIDIPKNKSPAGEPRFCFAVPMLPRPVLLGYCALNGGELICDPSRSVPVQAPNAAVKAISKIAQIILILR